MKFFAVIMAGGLGGRLWPLSRRERPKQFHAITSDKTLIRETFERLLPKFQPEQIFISTVPNYEKGIKKILPEIPSHNFIVEPDLMGNAAACCLVTKTLYDRDNSSTIIFLPSDAFIRDEKDFVKTINFAEKLSKEHSNNIITIGIKPTKPDVNLGYIEIENQIKTDTGAKAYSVKRFVEKPNRKKALEYISSEKFLWNSGIFVWNAEHMLSLYKKNLPKTLEIIEKILSQKDKDVIKKLYSTTENTSIDYAIMEKTKNIIVIPADFGWSDVGSWEALHQVLTELKKSDFICEGHHIGIDNSNCLIKAGKKLVATVGLKNITVIDTPDAILICDNKKSHKVKDLIAAIKEQGEQQYL